MVKLSLNRIFSRFYNSYPMIFGRRTSANDSDDQLKSEKCLSSMRQSFHGALTTCRAPLPTGKKYVAVQFLSKELIFYVVDAKGRGKEVFDEASKHLGLTDTELFGLAFYQDGEYIFIDLNLKVSKYAVRSWKTHINGVSGDGQPLLVLHMRVKYYVDCHLLINEKVVRHHYYLQLCENVRNYSQPLSEEKSFLLAALALQADLGNYNEEKHKNRYFEISNYFPSWIVQKIGEGFIVRHIPALHRDNAGLSRGEAQVGYIKEASDPTAPHNLHLYKMRRKKGKMWRDVWLAIGDSGVHIYEDLQSIKSLLSTFLWCDISKLHFEKKKFEILSEGCPESRRFTYFVQSEELSKQLLWMCRATHHFHMANQGRVADLKKLQLDGGKVYREAYIYTDELDKDREKRNNTLQKSASKSKLENLTINFNGVEGNSASEQSLKPVNMKMSGMPWEGDSGLENGQCVSSHHSMEVLPLTNGSKLYSDLKYRSQSIPCLPDRTLTPYSASTESCNSSELWCPPPSCDSTTPSSTLLSRSSCTSNTDSNCSSLSLASSSTLKVGSSWVKCDSFEEIPLSEPSSPEQLMQKVCISTFQDKHVRTASVYDAVSLQKMTPLDTARSIPNSAATKCSSGAEIAKPPLCAASMNCIPQLNVSSRTSAISSHCIDASAETTAIRNNLPIVRSPSDLKLALCNDAHADRTSLPSAVSCVQPQQSSSLCNHVPAVPSHTSNRQHSQTKCRTATRIGVSSLSREQRLPLSLFDERRLLACGSEPNLYLPTHARVSTSQSKCSTTPKSRLHRNTNSRSEMNLNVVNGACGESALRDGLECGSRQMSLPDVCMGGEEGVANFPCIPPPPAYRNDDGSSEEVTQSMAYNGRFIASDFRPPPSLNKFRGLRTQSSPPDVLDIHQLRQRSLDLDLPLISALCNDRSLLMLPKTVPTCSRQRHLAGKDAARFYRATSLTMGEQPLQPVRPVSWHVDSRQVPFWPKPCSASWDCTGQRHDRLPSDGVKPRAYSVDAADVPVPHLPPTILTSFVKTPARHVRTPRSHDTCYRSDKSQMIPTKLLAGSLGNIANGRLYQKSVFS